VIQSNPFCTRFVRPGAIPYRFPSDQNRASENPSLLDDQAKLQLICTQLQIDRVGMIIGPHGSGKSTLLKSLMPVLEPGYRKVLLCQLCDPRSGGPISRLRHTRQSWRMISQQFSRMDDRDLLIIDGIDQLSTLNRFGLLLRSNKRGPSILATAHRPWFSTRVLFETKLDRHRICELTEQLLRDSPIELIGIVSRKLASHDCSRMTNLRDFWFECYDDVQDHLRQPLES